LSDILDDFFGKKKAIQTATSNEEALNQQIKTLKANSTSQTEVNTAKIQSLTEKLQKQLTEITRLKEEAIISKSKLEEATLTEPSSSESAAAGKASPSKKSSKKLKEASSSTPEDSTENSDSSSDDQKN